MAPVQVPNFTLSNGEKIPALGLGTYAGENMKEVIKNAIEIGYRLIDTAYLYNNEKEIGEAISEILQEGKIKREDLFIITKVWSTQHRDVISAVKNSLADLQVDYVDLYLMHWPMAFKPVDNPFSLRDMEEDDVPFEKTWLQMEKCLELGYAKSIGISNFNSEQVERLLKAASIVPAVNEIEVNPYLTQEKLIKLCKSKGIEIVAYSPFYKNNERGIVNNISIFNEPIINEIAKKYKKSAGQVILRYLTQLNVIPIPKTDKVERLKENISIFDITLNDTDMKKVGSLNVNRRCTPFPQVAHFKEYPFSSDS